jgi:hypothetical protein
MNRPKLTSQDDAGLRKLAGAMFVQALEDLKQGDEQTRAGAWQWLSGENEAGLSFVLCCRILGCRPEVVRRGLLRTNVGAEPVVTSAHLAAQAAELVEQFAG